MLGEGSAGEARGRERVLLCAGCGLFAALVLLLASGFLRPDRLHLHGKLVDQAAYVTTARILADTGELRSGLVLPAHADEPSWRPYMPGHYAVLALVYRLAGWSPLLSVLPSLAAQVLATMCVFLVGNRLFGAVPGAAAAGAQALFPANLLYANTAMAELTFSAASMCALALFLHVPGRWRPAALAPLLAVPFLFRETGAVLVIPMAAFWIARAGGRRGPVLVALVSAPILLALLQSWQVASGKADLLTSRVEGEGFNYGDALVRPAERSISELLPLAAENVARNVRLAVESLSEPWGQHEILFVLTAAAILFALAAGALRLRRDALPAALGGTAAIVVALLLAFYEAKTHKVVRTTLFTMPLCFVALASLLPVRGAADLAELRARPGRAAGTLLALLLAAAGSLAFARAAGSELARKDRAIEENIARIEQVVRHDEGKLLVVDFGLMPFLVHFAVERYPARVSFLPTNDATFGLLAERYRVGTVIIDTAFLDDLVSRHALLSHGLAPRAEITTDGRVYRVFQGREERPPR